MHLLTQYALPRSGLAVEVVGCLLENSTLPPPPLHDAGLFSDDRYTASAASAQTETPRCMSSFRATVDDHRWSSECDRTRGLSSTQTSERTNTDSPELLTRAQ